MMNSLYRFVRHPRIYTVISMLLVIMTMSFTGWEVGRYMDKERDLPLIQTLGAYVSALEGGTINSQAMGAAIMFGLENQQAKLLLGKATPDVSMQAMDSLRVQFLADAVLLVNKQGIIVAQSQGKAHVVGRDLSSQPFVQLAMQGSPNVYPAATAEIDTPGIYLAAPVRSGLNNASDTIGAIVIRIGYDKLNMLLQSWTDGIALLLSPQGVIFASNRDDWLFRMTDETKIHHLADNRQFGNMLNQAPILPLALNSDESNIEGVHYVLRGQTLDWHDPKGDWRLVLLEHRAPWWTQWRILIASALAGLFATLMLFWFFNLLRNTILLKEINAQLQYSDEVLREHEKLLIETQSIAGLGTYTFYADKRQFEISDITYSLFGIDDNYELSVDGWMALIHPDDRAMVQDYLYNEVMAHRKPFDKEYRIIRRSDQNERWMHGLGKLKFDEEGNLYQMVGTVQDVTLRKQAETEIQSLAYYDHLTGLPNRRLLLERLRHTLTTCARGGLSGALLFIDLDNFKSLNDSLGHDVGDLLLQQVGIRLTSCVRENDTVARLGGDEFVVMLDDLHNNPLEAATQAETIGEKILAVLAHSYLLATHECYSTPSIGIALFDGHDKTIDELLKHADIAMYQAKKAGRNTLRFFDPEMQIAMMARIALESDLRQAIDCDGQLMLYYQRQVDSLGRLTGAEALVRWHHPLRGMMSSNEFIPLAEDSGLIQTLGHWVLKTSCQQLAIWALQADRAELTLSVNISAKQFNLPNFCDMVLTLLDEFQIGNGKLKLEITESFLLNNVTEVISKMKTLQDRGVSFSMDDFGTGYSSLQYLKQLPLDQLKIDRSFIRDLASNNNDQAIVRTIIAMAHSLNLQIIAEGVETEEQRQFLLNEGCVHYQGYLFGKPLPAEQFDALS